MRQSSASARSDASSPATARAPGRPGLAEKGFPGRDRTAGILEQVRAIPEGFVRTYGDIDRAAPRFVGHVLATRGNDVPWHRVVRADGTVPMGARQAARLRREGVPFRGGRVDLGQARIPR